VASQPDTCDLLCLDLPKAEAVRAARPSERKLDAAAQRARALSDPTRLLVALALRAGEELCICDLAWVCERSDKLVSHHARALRAAGLVQSRRDGKMVMYSLTDAGRALLEAVSPQAGVPA
jgi:ArsR family transcriptional regulator, lead/cadmium/zinc/bismuth-responsive transcriptional repressor